MAYFVCTTLGSTAFIKAQCVVGWMREGEGEGDWEKCGAKGRRSWWGVIGGEEGGLKTIRFEGTGWKERIGKSPGIVKNAGILVRMCRCWGCPDKSGTWPGHSTLSNFSGPIVVWRDLNATRFAEVISWENRYTPI